MKHNVAIFPAFEYKAQFSIIVALILLASACKNNDPQPKPTETQNIIYSDSSQFTGRLNISVYDRNSNKIPNTDIYLYLSYEDLIHDLYILYINSNSSGFADFGYINFGNYYLRAYSNAGGQPVYDTTVVQVRPRRVTSKNIILN